MAAKRKNQHRTIVGDPPRDVQLKALSHGGFLALLGNTASFEPGPVAAFTTLTEALAWLATNMAQPVEKPIVFVKKG